MTKGSFPHTRRSRGAHRHRREPQSPHQTNGAHNPLIPRLPWGASAHGCRTLVTTSQLERVRLRGHCQGCGGHHGRAGEGHFKTAQDLPWDVLGSMGKGRIKVFCGGASGKQWDKGTKGAGHVQAGAGRYNLPGRALCVTSAVCPDLSLNPIF